MSDMTIQEAIEKMSDFITMMFDRQSLPEHEQEEIEEVESVIYRYVELKENEV